MKQEKIEFSPEKSMVYIQYQVHQLKRDIVFICPNNPERSQALANLQEVISLVEKSIKNNTGDIQE